MARTLCQRTESKQQRSYAGRCQTLTVEEVLTKSGALAIIGVENIFPATPRVLDAENTAWEAAQAWLAQNSNAVAKDDRAA